MSTSFGWLRFEMLMRRLASYNAHTAFCAHEYGMWTLHYEAAQHAGEIMLCHE